MLPHCWVECSLFYGKCTRKNSVRDLSACIIRKKRKTNPWWYLTTQPMHTSSYRVLMRLWIALIYKESYLTKKQGLYKSEAHSQGNIVSALKLYKVLLYEMKNDLNLTDKYEQKYFIKLLCFSTSLTRKELNKLVKQIPANDYYKRFIVKKEPNNIECNYNQLKDYLFKLN